MFLTPYCLTTGVELKTSTSLTFVHPNPPRKSRPQRPRSGNRKTLDFPTPCEHTTLFLPSQNTGKIVENPFPRVRVYDELDRRDNLALLK